MKRFGNFSDLQPRTRLTMLLLAGAAVLSAGMFLTRPSSGFDTAVETVAASSSPRMRSATSKGAQGAPPRALEMGPPLPTTDRLTEHVTFNPFAALNLNVAPAPAPAASAAKPVAKKAPDPAPPPPAPPMAPPLPFTVVGAIAGEQVTDGKSVAFIKVQDHLLVIHSGDAIPPSYRVESITAQKIDFIYLPLMQHQSLALSQ
jgi:hypothetical protein